MKKTIVALMLLSVTVFLACSGNSSQTRKDSTAGKSAADTSKVSAVKYTCTMHPEVISDTPGKCPKCGMALVPMMDSSMQKMNIDSMTH